MAQAKRGERFFFFYALALFAIVVVFFPAHALVNGLEHLPPIRPILHLHAVSMGSWYALMVVQTLLIARGNTGLHRTLGVASLALVPVMLGTGMFVSWENMQRTGEDAIFIGNSANSIVFLIFYSLALINRTRPDFHKRFMIFAGLALMIPAFARVAYVFQLNVFSVLPMWLVFLLAVPVYDLITQRKLKLASGTALIINALYIATLLAMGPPPE